MGKEKASQATLLTLDRLVIYLHGGPGGSTSIENTAFFDPAVYRVVLLDQRGAGKSTPNAELRENTSQHLVADIEALREHLHISKWHMVFGGSWGSTLALLYAQTHPEAVGSLVLRGIFAFRKSELDWLYLDGASHIFPEYYDEFINHLSPDKRDHPISAYYELLTSEDPVTRLAAARAWSRYEYATSTLFVDEEAFEKLNDDLRTLAHSRIEAHYFLHGAWLEEGQLLKRENIDKIRHIPATIIQGRYDVVCPARSAYDLHKAWPESTMIWIPDAGHSAEEPGTKKKLIEVCDQYANLSVPLPLSIFSYDVYVRCSKTDNSDHGLHAVGLSDVQLQLYDSISACSGKLPTWEACGTFIAQDKRKGEKST